MQTRALHELDVCERCKSDILLPEEQAFVMMAERMVKRQGVWKLITDVAFQKYIFVETRDTDDLRIRLRQIRDMSRLLGTGEEIVPIRQEEEDLLRRLGGEEHLIRFSTGYAMGDRLVVTDGPLKGMEGLVVWVDRHQRMVGLETILLGQKVTIKLGCEVVQRLAGA